MVDSSRYSSSATAPNVAPTAGDGRSGLLNGIVDLNFPVSRLAVDTVAPVLVIASAGGLVGSGLALRTARPASLRLVGEPLFLVKLLLVGGEDEVTAAVGAGNLPVLELHFDAFHETFR